VPPLNDLIQRFLDEQRELSSDELDALIAGLRAEPARAVELREQLLVDDLVAQKLALDRRNFLAQVEQRLADFEQAENEIDQQVAELHSLASAPVEPASGSSGMSTWLKAALALSLAAMVAGFFILTQFLRRQPHVVARVIQVGGPVATVRAEQKTSLSAEESLYAGQQIESPVGGSLALAYADQTGLRLGSDTLVTLDEQPGTSAKRVHISRGELWADVAPQTGGAMQFITPHAVATVLGTQLHLMVSNVDTLLKVEEGKVRLDHVNAADSIDVAAHESGLATPDSLDLRTVEWPSSTDGLAFVFDPFAHRIPQTRNPLTGNWLSAPLEPVGSAMVNELDNRYELSGGYFPAPDEGADIVRVSRDFQEFTLDIAFAPSPEQRGLARIAGLESNDGATCFSLSQEGDELVFELDTGSPNSFAPLRVPLSAAAKTGEAVHLTICYRDGQLTAYRSGRAIASRDEWHGSLAAWQEGPLLIGADSRGQNAWRGSVESLALYHRCLDSAEVARNVQNYQILSGRSP
jgi:hypothetical protein